MRLALAAVHSGIGELAMNRILGILDAPAPSHDTYARAEKRVYEALLVVGERSMARRLEVERDLA